MSDQCIPILKARDLLSEIRKIPYKYDDVGSHYFHKITEQTEYYLTSKEQELLDTKMQEILQSLTLSNLPANSLVEVVELGCGMGRKTLTFLHGLLSATPSKIRFVPIDVSSYYLGEVQAYYSSRLAQHCFSVRPFCGQYQEYLSKLTQQLKLAHISNYQVDSGCEIANTWRISTILDETEDQDTSSLEPSEDTDSTSQHDYQKYAHEPQDDIKARTISLACNQIAIEPAPSARLFVFMGSSLGNYLPQDATELLQQIAAALRPQDFLLLGVDTIYKPACEILSAYDDPEGWSALFNLNTFNNVNCALGTNFPVDAYRHAVEYDGETLRTCAVATRDHQVQWGTHVVAVESGEKLLMEVSDKYSTEKIERYAAAAGMQVVQNILTTDNKFMWSVLRAVDATVAAKADAGTEA